MKKLEQVKKEVENIKDSLGKPIDPKIKDLIVGLRRWDIETLMSCEGHEDGLKYPWVDVDLGSIEKLARIISIWWKDKGDNVPASDQPRWLMKVFAGMVRIIPENKDTRTLQEMQEDAENFGKFLQEITSNYF